MKIICGFLSLLLLLCAAVFAQEAAKPAMKVAVMDFVTADTIGLKILERLPAAPAPQVMPSDGANATVNVLFGIGKLLDGVTTESPADSKWQAQRELFLEAVKGKGRPAIMGAEYLAAFLGKHPETFGIVDAMVIKGAMAKLQKEDDFPRNFLQKVAKETGATHLICGTIADIRSKENSFKGYGVETKTTLFQLDVIIKVIDLQAQHTVFTNVYTGSYKEQRPISVEQFDNNIYQSLMTVALEQAAEELCEVCQPGNPEGIFKKQAEE
jgi:hypothetical protein